MSSMHRVCKRGDMYDNDQMWPVRFQISQLYTGNAEYENVEGTDRKDKATGGVSEWRKFQANSLPNDGRSPK